MWGNRGILELARRLHRVNASSTERRERAPVGCVQLKLQYKIQIMKLSQWLVMAGVAAVMSLGTNQLVAQPNGGGQGGPGGGRGNRGNFIDRFKDTLEVTDDAEWKAMQPLVQKVMDIRMESMRRGMGRGGRGGGNNGQPADQQGGQGRGGMSTTPNPDYDALQKAIDSKASKAELKAALEKYVTGRKARLEQAQADLRKVLTSRQEAIATLNGLL